MLVMFFSWIIWLLFWVLIIRLVKLVVCVIELLVMIVVVVLLLLRKLVGEVMLVVCIVLCRLLVVRFSVFIRCRLMFMCIVGVDVLVMLIEVMLLIWWMCCVSSELVMLYSLLVDCVCEVSVMVIIGLLFGFVFWYIGEFMFEGRLVCVELIVVCIFSVVELMLWLFWKIMNISELFFEFDECMWLMFGSWLRWCFSGVVIVEVMVVVLVLDWLVCMKIIGILMFGSVDMFRCR